MVLKLNNEDIFKPAEKVLENQCWIIGLFIKTTYVNIFSFCTAAVFVS